MKNSKVAILKSGNVVDGVSFDVRIEVNMPNILLKCEFFHKGIVLWNEKSLGLNAYKIRRL
jgi:hypothetical protein